MIQRPIKKIAIIYDDALEYTTGLYCKRALVKMGFNVDHYSPDDLDGIQSIYDLYLNIDDNEHYPFPKELRPSAYWVIDTHVSDYEWKPEKAKIFDFIFVAQKCGMDRLKKDGIKNVFWLPLACDPDIHTRYEVAKEYDMSFVGSISHSKKRIDYLSFLKKSLKGKNIFIGQASPEETAMIYAKSKLVLNMSVADDINMRVFEVLACGRPLVTDDLRNKGQRELFGDKPPFIIYRSKRDLLKKIKYYLCNEDKSEEIARAGRQEAINKHTYLHRMGEIIQTIEKRGNYIKYNDFADDVSVIMDTVYGKIFNLIGENNKVLDIGCATGRFSKYLVSKKRCFVTGIDNDPLLLEKAKGVLSEVILGGAGEPDTYERIKHKYGFILLMDVLEHTANPDYILLKVKDFLGENGQVIITMPNIAYWAIRKELLLGRFNYDPEGGIMDDGHVRFFTYYTIKDLIERCGYVIKHWDTLYSLPFINNSHSLFSKIIKMGLIRRLFEHIARKYPNFFAHRLLFMIEKERK
ncbi:MAG: glycosyltransferase, partial [Candidatus Omnitrophica bacterium]|nr:glycosyltransferase [Candidatus Omnitrophota bacterium]